MRRAIFEVVVDGRDISSALRPILTSIDVSDSAGTQSDTASLELDDANGQIVLPKVKAPVVISMGWSDGPLREIFRGTVDEVRSSGSRSGGRTLSIQAKGVDTTGKAKEGQTRHFDSKTVKDVLSEAGAHAGITSIDIDPALAGIVLPYVDMRAESFLHLGERLAREIGAGFRVIGDRVVVAKRSGGYTASVSAAYGVNLHSWDITPSIGRARYSKTSAKTFDKAQGKEVVVTEDTGVPENVTMFRRELAADLAAARRTVKADASRVRETAGGGTVTIEGSTDAVPDGLCVLTGARAGIDGTYRIKTVNHSYSRGSGWITSLEVAEPQGTAGTDTRE